LYGRSKALGIGRRPSIGGGLGPNVQEDEMLPHFSPLFQLLKKCDRSTWDRSLRHRRDRTTKTLHWVRTRRVALSRRMRRTAGLKEFAHAPSSVTFPNPDCTGPAAPAPVKPVHGESDPIDYFIPLDEVSVTIQAIRVVRVPQGYPTMSTFR